MRGTELQSQTLGYSTGGRGSNPSAMSEDKQDAVLEKGEVLDSSTSDYSPLLNNVKNSMPAQMLLWALQSMRPSFLTTRQARSQTRLRKTAYLDGMRGFAAFLVYFVHHDLWAHEAQNGDKKFQSGYGYKNEYYFVALPFVRTFFTGGHMAVSIFLVVSGYCLSTKPISLLDKGEHMAFLDNIASALFRRWFRLWIPIIVVSFMLVCFYHLTGIYTNFVPQRNFRAEVWNWYCEFKNYSFIYGNPKIPWLSYHPHTWTIPVETRGSLIVYSSLIALSRSTRKMRLFGYAALAWYFMYIVDGAFYAMFMSGVFLCDMDMHLEDLPQWIFNLEPYQHIIFPVMFATGVFLGGCPSWKQEVNYLSENPGWYWLSKLKPQAVFDPKWFYLFWGAIMMAIATPRIPIVKNFFESRFCQYLGHISYMFYLVHGPVLWVLGDRFYAAVGWTRAGHALHLNGWVNRFPLPAVGPLGMEISFILPNLILLPVTFWLAELGTTLIDTPAIKFGQWLYKKFLPAPGSPQDRIVA